MIKYFVINATSAGNNVIVPASAFPNRRFMVLAYTFLSDANVTVTFKSGSTPISGPMPVLNSGGVSATSNFLAGGTGQPVGLMTTLNGNEDLILNLSTACNVGGHITVFVQSS